MILSWLKSMGCKDYSLLILGVIPICDAVGECLRFILFLDDLYGRVFDRVFPKGSRTLISSNVFLLIAGKAVHLLLADLRVFLWISISDIRRI